MKIAFRTDASLAIGTGHVMRCLTLARALRARGAECRFICRSHDGHLLDRVRESGFEAAELPATASGTPAAAADDPCLAHAAWLGASWQRDSEATIGALAGWVPEWLVVDHYAIDKRWQSALRPHCGRIMVIDDLADRDHDCDLLLDQNLVVDLDRRYDGRVPKQCALLLGPEYALLQPEYAELHPRTPPRLGPVERILISFGGADAHNLTGRAIDAFLSIGRSDIEVDVVINPASPHAPAIRRQVEVHANITLHESLPTLAYLMLKADLAIGAAGATSWERCCMGLPSIVVVLASNQAPIAHELRNRNLARVLGPGLDITTPELASAISASIGERDLHAWSTRCRDLVDGRGADRVAEAVALGRRTRLRARRAILGDEDRLLVWANDPAVRRSGFHPERIDPVTHRRWFWRRLRAVETCLLFVIETAGGMPIAQVRLERTGDEWELHYGLAAFARGRGLGAPVLATALEAAQGAIGGATVLGRVRTENVASRRIFERLGFSQSEEGGHMAYRRTVHGAAAAESPSPLTA